MAGEAVTNQPTGAAVRQPNYQAVGQSKSPATSKGTTNQGRPAGRDCQQECAACCAHCDGAHCADCALLGGLLSLLCCCFVDSH